MPGLATDYSSPAPALTLLVDLGHDPESVPSAQMIIQTVAFFILTALAEIVGCYLPWLVLKEAKSPWLLLPAAVSLALFAWLLTLHPSAAGRTYAAYGGVYVVIALLWLRFVDGVALTKWDGIGGAITLIGMAVIAFQPIAK